MASQKPLKKQYVKLDYGFLDSKAWRSLSLAAQALYIQIKAARNRSNGKGVVINRSDNHIRFGFADSTGMSRPTYYRAIRELTDKGFIGVMEPGRLPNRKAAYAIIDEWAAKDCEWQTSWD